MDTSGKELWQKTIGVSTHHEILTGIVETADSNLLFVGRKYNGNGFDNIVVKLNKNGQLVWNKNFGVSQYDEAFSSIIKSKDNNFIICGVSGTSEPQNITDESSVLIKIDKDGNKIWDKRYNNETSNMTFQQIEEFQDGSIAVVGQQDLKPYKAGITKFDKDGNLLWHRVFDYNPDYPERFNSFAKTADKGFIIGGQAFVKNTPPPNGSQGWLLKLDSLGCDYAGCSKSTATEEVEMEMGFSISPNPSNSYLNVSFDTEFLHSNSVLTIFNLQGKTIQIIDIQDSNLVIDTNNFESGVYFIKVANPFLNSIQKLIINH